MYDGLKTDLGQELIHGDSLNIVPNLPAQSIDLVITSPPYCLGKSYETTTDLADFKRIHEMILPEIIRVTKTGGSICWQVGYHVSKGTYAPLDFIVHEIMQRFDSVRLRNRIVWEVSHGHHLQKRFSPRHEVILWYTLGDDYVFNLDQVRVPQKYPGKRSYKGRNKGKLSSHPLGKNPSDVWGFPNVKAGHVEKTVHPCQFPIALPRRLIRALSNPCDTVLDPFAGVGSTAVAALIEKRSFVAIESNAHYVEIAQQRLTSAMAGELQYRDDSPALIPDPKWKVARRPDEVPSER